MLLATVLVLAAACHNVEGPDAPLGAFYFPQGLAVHPDGGHLYVVSTNFDGRYRDGVGGTVHVVDTDSLAVRAEGSIRIGSFGGTPVFLTDPSGDFLAVATRGDRSVHLLSIEGAGERLRCRGEITTEECRIENLPANPVGLAVLEERTDDDSPPPLLGVASLTGRLSLISVDPGAPEGARILTERLADGANLVARHPLADGLYTGGRFDWNLYAMAWVRDEAGAPEAGFVTRRVPIGIDATARGVRAAEFRSIAFSSDGTRAYLSAGNPGGVFVLDIQVDPDTGLPRERYIERLDVDGRPGEALVVSEGGHDTLYVAVSERDEIIAIDLRSGRVVTRIPVGRRPWSLAADPVRHQRLYVSLFEENAVAVIDINPESPTWRTVIGTIQ